jgi:hypothetical protein
MQLLIRNTYRLYKKSSKWKFITNIAAIELLKWLFFFCFICLPINKGERTSTLVAVVMIIDSICRMGIFYLR